MKRVSFEHITFLFVFIAFDLFWVRFSMDFLVEAGGRPEMGVRGAEPPDKAARKDVSGGTHKRALGNIGHPANSLAYPRLGRQDKSFLESICQPDTLQLKSHG